ncbi:PDZ domain-containing protein [Streptomyces sp. NPDC006334]|uniref:PDZ domain-containing protein n=1 Tax=Streptomyces sp. NPDC006334 TaxID=3156754 RepID=UPI0033B8B7C1
MEQIVLRAKPLPGQEPDDGGGGAGGGGVDAGAGAEGRVDHRPHTGGHPGRRPASLLCGLFAGVVLVLSGVALGALGTSVVAMRELGELRDQIAREASRTPGEPDGRPGVLSAPVGSKSSGGSGTSVTARDGARASLGLEVVDGGKRGARVVAVHVPGPGYTAGLVRGDVLLTFGRTRIDSATDLARAVERAGPGRRIDMTVRQSNGRQRRLSLVLGVVV